MADTRVQANIFARAVSSGTTEANTKRKNTVENPIWGKRTFDGARLAQRQERQEKAWFSFSQTSVAENDNFTLDA